MDRNDAAAARHWAEHPLNLVAGLVIWSIWFIAVYGGLSVACAVGAPDLGGAAPRGVIVGLAALTLAVIGVLCACALASRRAVTAATTAPTREGAEIRRFFATAGMALHVVAAVATAFTGLPLLAVPSCV